MARVAGYRRAGLRIREKNGAPQTGSAIKVDRTVDRWIGGYVCAPRSDGLDSEVVVKGASADQAVALVHASSPHVCVSSPKLPHVDEHLHLPRIWLK